MGTSWRDEGGRLAYGLAGGIQVLAWLYLFWIAFPGTARQLLLVPEARADAALTVGLFVCVVLTAFSLTKVIRTGRLVRERGERAMKRIHGAYCVTLIPCSMGVAFSIIRLFLAANAGA